LSLADGLTYTTADGANVTTSIADCPVPSAELFAKLQGSRIQYGTLILPCQCHSDCLSPITYGSGTTFSFSDAARAPTGRIKYAQAVINPLDPNKASTSWAVVLITEDAPAAMTADPSASSGETPRWTDSIPKWGVALIVLASVTVFLLLLLLLSILMCQKKTAKGTAAPGQVSYTPSSSAYALP